MAVTAKFIADFTQFDAAVTKADKELRAFDASADAAGQSVRQMGETTDRTTPKVNAMHQSFSRFDNLLAASGLNIGSEIRALRELGDVSGTTAKEIGAVATAGLAIGTAFASFSLTKAILEFTGLDKAIGDAVDAIHDFGKSAAEAGAKQDSITLAIQRGADAHISYGEAVRFNNEWATKHKQTAKDAADALEKWTAAMVDLNAVGAGWRGTLATIDGQVVESIKWYLEAGISQDKLATAFGLTAAQVKSVASAMAAHAVDVQKMAAADAKAAAEITKHWADVGTIIDDVFGVEALNAATTWVDAITALGGVAQLSSVQLTELEQAMLAGIDALARSGQLTSEQSSRFADLAIQAANAAAAMRPVVEVTDDLAQAQYDYALSIDKQLAAQAAANAAMGQVPAVAGPATDGVTALALAANTAAQGFFSMSAELYNAIRAAQAMDEQMQKNPQHWSRITGYFGGPTNTNTGAAALMAPAMASSSNITVNVTQPLGTPEAIARAVDEALMRQMRGNGTRLSSGS